MEQFRTNRARWPKGAWMKLIDPELLRRVMARRGTSLADLARSAGVSKGFISHLTAGRKKTCTPRVAQRIAERLDVDLDFLFVPSVSPTGGQIANQQRKAA